MIAFLPIWLSASPEADGGGGLALAGGRRADRGDQDQLAVLLRLQRVEVRQRHLRLVVPVGLEVLLGDAELFLRDLGDALQLRSLRDFDVRRHVGLPLVEAAILQGDGDSRP